MDAELYRYLDDDDARAVRELIALCGEADGTAYGDAADADFYYLVRNSAPEESGCDAALLSVLCGFRLGETLDGQDALEIMAFTHPELRQLGFFTLCLNSLRDDFRGFAFKFAVKGHAAGETLSALKARHLYDELFLEKELPQSIQDPADTLCCREGEVHFLPYGPDTLYLYGLLVYDRFRGQGFGERLMRALEQQPSGPYRKILLQVSSENCPALSLYTKLGYQTADATSYYTLP